MQRTINSKILYLESIKFSHKDCIYNWQTNNIKDIISVGFNRLEKDSLEWFLTDRNWFIHTYSNEEKEKVYINYILVQEEIEEIIQLLNSEIIISHPPTQLISLWVNGSAIYHLSEEYKSSDLDLVIIARDSKIELLNVNRETSSGRALGAIPIINEEGLLSNDNHPLCTDAYATVFGGGIPLYGECKIYGDMLGIDSLKLAKQLLHKTRKYFYRAPNLWYKFLNRLIEAECILYANGLIEKPDVESYWNMSAKIKKGENFNTFSFIKWALRIRNDRLSIINNKLPNHIRGITGSQLNVKAEYLSHNLSTWDVWSKRVQERDKT